MKNSEKRITTARKIIPELSRSRHQMIERQTRMRKKEEKIAKLYNSLDRKINKNNYKGNNIVKKYLKQFKIEDPSRFKYAGARKKSESLNLFDPSQRFGMSTSKFNKKIEKLS